MEGILRCIFQLSVGNKPSLGPLSLLQENRANIYYAWDHCTSYKILLNLPIVRYWLSSRVSGKRSTVHSSAAYYGMYQKCMCFRYDEEPNMAGFGVRT